MSDVFAPSGSVSTVSSSTSYSTSSSVDMKATKWDRITSCDIDGREDEGERSGRRNKISWSPVINSVKLFRRNDCPKLITSGNVTMYSPTAADLEEYSDGMDLCIGDGDYMVEEEEEEMRKFEEDLRQSFNTKGGTH